MQPASTLRSRLSPASSTLRETTPVVREARGARAAWRSRGRSSRSAAYSTASIHSVLRSNDATTSRRRWNAASRLGERSISSRTRWRGYDSACLEADGEALGGLGRIGTLRQRYDPHLDELAIGELHAAERRLLTGGVGVEAEDRARAEAPQLAQLTLGQRGAHRGHGGDEPGLVERDDVRVALDHDGQILLGDGRPGPIEPVDHCAFLEQLGLRRVDVLRLDRIGVGEPPRAEAEHPTLAVGERKDEPRAEVIVSPSVGEACGGELLARVPLRGRLARQDVPAGGEAEAEAAGGFLLEAAACQIARTSSPPWPSQSVRS